MYNTFVFSMTFTEISGANDLNWPLVLMLINEEQNPQPQSAWAGQ